MQTVIMAILSGMSKIRSILIDDILNTGKTFSEAAKIVERRANEIYAVSSRGFICERCCRVIVSQAPIKEIFSNRFCLLKWANTKNINYLTASELIIEAIVRHSS